MAALRTLDEIREAGALAGLEAGPLSQEAADRVAAILAPWLARAQAQAA